VLYPGRHDAVSTRPDDPSTNPRALKNWVSQIRRAGHLAGTEEELTVVDVYSVLIETRADDDAILAEVAVEAFVDAVGPYFGAVDGGLRSWSARISVEARDAAGAAALAAALVTRLAEQAGLPAWPVVRAEAVRADMLDEDLTQSQLPDLVSGPEAAEILSVSVQRLHQLAAEHPDFPAPAYKLRAASLWLRPAITAFGDRWDRKPGRPRKDRRIA